MPVKTSESDEQLMERLSQGELSCAGHIFERYHVRLYNFFLRWNSNESLSEDMVQMVFERMIKYRHTYKSGMLFRSWFYQIARNVRFDRGKKKKFLISDHVQPEDLGLKEQSFSEKMELEEEKSLLHRALKKLTSDQQEIIELARFQELRYKEIGDLIGCSEGAVKVRVHRAIHQLRTHYFKMQQL